MYKNICFGKIRFPRGVIGDDGKQFVKGVSADTGPRKSRRKLTVFATHTIALEPEP